MDEVMDIMNTSVIDGDALELLTPPETEVLDDCKGSGMDLLEHILFINLEQRTDRLIHIHNEFEKLGIENAERMNAVKTANGAIGCTLSHIKCIEKAKQQKWEYVCVMEDDIVFTNPILFMNSLDKFYHEYHSKGLPWKVLILGGNACPPYEMIGDYMIRVINCQTTTGYICHSSYYDTLLQNFKESADNLVKTGIKQHFALDVYWKRLQYSSRQWYMLYPPTITQMDGHSDIENRSISYTHLMLDLEKRWLFERPVMPMSIGSSTSPNISNRN